MISKSKLDEAIQLAENSSAMSTCDRAYVGCVILDTHGNIVSHGYNSTHHGLDPYHVCEAHGHHMIEDHCHATYHAEFNAIISALERRGSLNAYTMVITHSPCKECAKLIMRVGITTLYIREFYRRCEHVLDWFRYYGMEMLYFDGRLIE